MIRVLFAATGFSLGFGLMFFMISLPIVSLSSISHIRNVVSVLGSLLLIVVGLIMLDIIKIPILAKYFRIFSYNPSSANQGNISRDRSFFVMFLSSFLVGLSFSSGWAPCAGPVMLGILSLLSNQQNIISAVLMLLFMKVGLMTGFILTSFIAIAFGNVINRLSKLSIFLERMMGVIFIILGFMIMFSKMNFLFSWGIGLEFMDKFNYQITNFSLFTASVSFIAGIFLFLSPCTLPLVIPYLFYLTGISIQRK
ncbi:MAG: cytochrome c biogenesis protein CcdA [Candidatus Calescibacterium sp.]|nr:cytochrome c biogenesis protein CcdA [Candidatus Calescibacterium sp.]MDW8194627.1 cytochrome c biogenesis protein CcdA [Candidatus Calescibacterium sp.]